MGTKLSQLLFPPREDLLPNMEVTLASNKTIGSRKVQISFSLQTYNIQQLIRRRRFQILN